MSGFDTSWRFRERAFRVLHEVAERRPGEIDTLSAHKEIEAADWLDDDSGLGVDEVARRTKELVMRHVHA